MIDLEAAVARALSRDAHLLVEAPSYTQRSERLRRCLEQEAIDRQEPALFAAGPGGTEAPASRGPSSANPPTAHPSSRLDGFRCRAYEARAETSSGRTCPVPPNVAPLEAPTTRTSPRDCLLTGCPFARDCADLQAALAPPVGVQPVTFSELVQWLRMMARADAPATSSVRMVVVDDADLFIEAARSGLGDRLEVVDLMSLVRSLAALGRTDEGHRLAELISAFDVALAEHRTVALADEESRIGELVLCLEEVGAILDQEAQRLREVGDTTWTAWALDARAALRHAGFLHAARSGEMPTHRFRVTEAFVPALVSRYQEPGRWLADHLFRAHRSVILAGPALSFGGDQQWIREALGVPDQAECVRAPIAPAMLRETRLIVPDFHRTYSDPTVASAVTLDRLTLALKCPVRLEFRSVDALDYALEPTHAGRFEVLPDGDRTSAIVLGPRRPPSWPTLPPPPSTPDCACLLIDGLLLKASGYALALTAEEWANDGFFRLVLPRAVLRFRRQLDRLFDGSTRRRAVVVSDTRLLERGYSGLFLAGLEEVPLYREFEDLATWLAARTADVTPSPSSVRPKRRRKPDAPAGVSRPRPWVRARQLNLFPRYKR